ncbi:hypothetical protein [Bdellovibrio sp. HCB337]|uniref:hypothetical protein n=1 Tax=Bdellovibrio sp. HCB337 TaxID=3394358 RepID=UPI0039A54B5E
MKKLIILLALAFVIISVCMIYLVKSGVSLRSAPIIRPSDMSEDRSNIAHALVYRLSPEFKDAHYILWGFLPQNSESQKVFAHTRTEYEKVFQQPVHILENAEAATEADLQACEKPCWLLVSKDKAHELTKNEFIEQKLRPLNRSYFSMTWLAFTKAEQVPDFCVQEKRLTLECLRVLGIHEFQRKMKPGHQHFFLKKYKDTDFFLFFQESPQQ